jgi:hypothetical protein
MSLPERHGVDLAYALLGAIELWTLPKMLLQAANACMQLELPCVVLN